MLEQLQIILAMIPKVLLLLKLILLLVVELLNLLSVSCSTDEHSHVDVDLLE